MFNHILRTFLILTLLTAANALGQTSDNSLVPRIDSMVLTKMRDTKVVGVAIGIVKNGSIYCNRGYGTKALNNKRPVDSLANFHLASISKVFVATAIMQLVEQDKIHLDTKLLEYIPVSKLRDKRFKNVTIRQMLTHRSGIPDVWNYNWRKPRNDSLALGNYAKKSIHTKKLRFNPGSKWRYSNIAFEILGHVVENVTNKPFDVYEYDHVLSRTGLNHSNFDYTKIDQSRRTSPHIKRFGKAKVSKIYPYNREHGPSSTLNSCTYDMCKWMLEMIKIYEDTNGTYHGVIKHKTLINMWTVQNTTPPVGLAWWVDQTPMGLLAWHNGGDRGYVSLLMINPEQRFGMIMLINSDYSTDQFFADMPAAISMLFKDR